MGPLDDLRPDPPAPTTAAGERLLEAAEELFYRRGITAVGVDLVADTAGTTKRTLYQRFGSKDGLTAGYLARRAHRWQHHLLDALGRAQPATPAAAVEVVLATAREWTDDRRGCAFVNAWAELGGSAHPGVEVVRAEKRWMRELFTRLAGDPAAGAAVHLLYEGAQVAVTTTGDERAFAEAARAASTLLAPG